MTTGVPIYLVSACASAEEFVAAFRRYVDRSGVFIPMAEPLPAGKSGRLALTLADGGVMIEGEAQVVSSSVKPVGMHGRAGMVVKFVEPDEPSKTVIGELEKARLAMKPAPSSVPPRAADVPPSPRPAPPPVGGRIDASNARAECVAIGDVASLRETPAAKAASANDSGGLLKAGQKFVVPSIPSFGAPPVRAKSPTAPPPAAEDKPTAVSPPIVPPAPIAAVAVEDKPTTIGELESVPEPVPEPIVAPAPPAAPKPPMVAPKPRQTSFGMPAVTRAPAAPAPKVETPAPKATSIGMMPLKVTNTQPLPLAKVPDEAAQQDSKPQRGDPTLPLTRSTLRDKSGLPSPRRSHSPSTPPMPRNPTPVVPLPVARLPAMSASSAGIEIPSEATDISEPPQPPEPPAAGAVAFDAPTVDSGKAFIGPPPQPEPRPGKPARSGGMRASEIMAAIPSDDWTMTPDASGPTVLPAGGKLEAPQLGEPRPVIEATTPTKGPPTGDWTIQANPEAPDGWTQPAKVGKPASHDRPLDVPAPTGKPATGNPVHQVASDKPIAVQQWEDKPTGIGEPLVEIDSTLMEPLTAMPADDARAAPGEPRGRSGSVPPPLAMSLPPLAPPAPGVLVSSSSPTQPLATVNPQLGAALEAPAFPPGPPSDGHAAPLAPPPMGVPPGPVPMPSQYPPNADQAFALMSLPPPRLISDGGTNFFRDSEQVARYGSDIASTDARRKKRVVAIAVGSALGAVLIAIAVMAVTGKKRSANAGASAGAGSAMVANAGSASATGSAGSAQALVAPVGSAAAGSAAAEVPAPSHGSDTPPPAPEACKIDVTTTPPGAQIALDKGDVLGTSPGTFELPCDAEVKLVARKPKYYAVTKAVTPSGPTTKVEFPALAKMTFLVKVTSTPAGATITVGGKAMGVTPTTIRLPAFDAATIVVAKDGYTSDSQKLTPKQNNIAHHVNLKKTAYKHL